MNKRTVNRTPRVAVTLSPESMRILEEISTLVEQPKSALIADLVDTALPALLATLEALKVIKDQPREAQRLLSNYGAQAVMQLSQQQLALDEVLDGRTVKGKRAKRAKGASSEGTT